MPFQRLFKPLCHLALASVLAFAARGIAAQTVVRVSGTGSGVGGMHLLSQAFMKANPGSAVRVEPALGSSGGIGALISGHIELAVSNRQPKEAELARLAMTSIEYARTPVVIAVSRDLGVSALSSSQLAGLFSDGAVTFPNGKRARPVLRLADATDTELLKAFSPEVAKAVDAAAKRRGMLSADTDSEAAGLVEHTAGAFALTTLALIESEKRPLTPLAIDDQVPSMASFAAGTYPHYKSLYMIVGADAGSNTRKFAAFVQSAAGRALLSAHGHQPR